MMKALLAALLSLVLAVGMIPSIAQAQSSSGTTTKPAAGTHKHHKHCKKHHKKHHCKHHKGGTTKPATTT